MVLSNLFIKKSKHEEMGKCGKMGDKLIVSSV